MVKSSDGMMGKEMSGNGPEENYPSPFKNIYQTIPVHDDIVIDKSNKRWEKEGSGSAMKRKKKRKKKEKVIPVCLRSFWVYRTVKRKVKTP